MKYEPPLDRAHLIDTIRSMYGVHVTGLTFVPVGFVAACYKVTCEDGSRYFLKLWLDGHTSRALADRRETILRLTRALPDRGLYGRVSYPIPTQQNTLSACFGTAAFAIFPLLPGHAPPDPMPDDLRDEWARVMATIHRATPALRHVLPPRETFDIPFEDDLWRGLAALDHMSYGSRPGLRALCDLLLPRRDEIMDQLARLHRLQASVRELDVSFVVCHTDMGGDNLLVDDHKRLWVLDWDDATLAPPEYDLYEARGQDFARFVHVYRSAGGAGPLHVDHFAFCLLRRYLGDMAARLVRILQENRSDQQDHDDLDGIEAWGFKQWRALDQTLDQIGAAL